MRTGNVSVNNTTTTIINYSKVHLFSLNKFENKANCELQAIDFVLRKRAHDWKFSRGIIETEENNGKYGEMLNSAYVNSNYVLSYLVIIWIHSLDLLDRLIKLMSYNILMTYK